MTKWTEKEIKFLEEHFKSHGLEWCVERLPGRTINAVRNKAWKLGLSKRAWRGVEKDS